MKMKYALLGVLLFLISCSAAAETPAANTSPPTEAPLLDENADLSWEFTTVDIDGVTIEYATLLPPDYDAGNMYPLLLALPPGSQDRSMVNAGLESFWQRGALYGFVIVSPVKPAGTTYMSDGSLSLPAFVQHLHDSFNIDGKPHLGGVSNGGISTFKAGLEHPELYQSLTVLPGYARVDGGDLTTLKDLKITLYVGENDGGWVTNSQSTHDRLVASGHTDVILEIVPDEGHLIGTLIGDGAGQIFERLLGQ